MSPYPPLIRGLGGELPIEQMRRNRLIMIAHGRAFEPLPHLRLQIGGTALRVSSPT